MLLEGIVWSQMRLDCTFHSTPISRSQSFNNQMCSHQGLAVGEILKKTGEQSIWRTLLISIQAMSQHVVKMLWCGVPRGVDKWSANLCVRQSSSISAPTAALDDCPTVYFNWWLSNNKFIQKLIFFYFITKKCYYLQGCCVVFTF